MAAVIIEEQPEDTNLDQLPADEAAQTTQEVVSSFTPEANSLTEQPASEDDLPEKYRGKAIQDIVAMHQEAEKALGRQGSEVGELRKVVDGYIQKQMTQQTQPVEEEEIDFFEDPQRAVSRAIETHPEVMAARETSVTMKRQQALGALKAKHSDMETVLGNPQFAEWVQGSPMRVRMFQEADRDFNFDAADELISTWKERTRVAEQTVNHEVESRQQQLKAAQTGSAQGANTAGAKRVYRRTDIIKLMKDDPDRYDALSTEIMKAYQEGRVR